MITKQHINTTGNKPIIKIQQHGKMNRLIDFSKSNTTCKRNIYYITKNACMLLLIQT